MKYFFTIFMLLLIGTCYGQYSYILNVESAGLEGKKVRLHLLDNARQLALKVDSSTCRNGKLRFSGSIPQPVQYVEIGYKINGKPLSVKFPLDSGEHTIKLDITRVVNGEPLISGLETNSRKIQLESQRLWHTLYDKYPLGVNGRNLPAAVFHEDLKNQLQLVSLHPKDFFSVLLLNDIGASDVSLNHARLVLEAWAKLDASLAESPLGLSVYNRQKNFTKGYLAAKVGNEIINFTVNDADGNTFDSRSLKGQNYLIVFSATWCLPCQKQLPLLKRIYDKYKQLGLKVVYFNNDDDEVRWKEHISKNKLTWINVSERQKFSNSKIPKSFGIYAIPTCILVDSNGKITYNSDQEDIGLEKLEAAVEKTR